MVATGVVPAPAVGASRPILAAATSIAPFVSAIRGRGDRPERGGRRLRDLRNLRLSCCPPVLGLTHGWFGINAADVPTYELVLTASLIVVVVLTPAGRLCGCRRPPAILALIDPAPPPLLSAPGGPAPARPRRRAASCRQWPRSGPYRFDNPDDPAGMATGGRAPPPGRSVMHAPG